MTSDDFKRSTANLKKAVPLMMKNHVAATPANYALWYTYVDNAIPQLNRELDSVLENFGLCPPAASSQLYNSYVASRSETSLSTLRNNIEVLVNEVASSMSDTLTDTSEFARVIDKSFSELERVENDDLSIEEVMKVVRQLVTESRDIRHSTQFLNGQLNSASKEIHRLKEQLAEVQKEALFDGLSGLYNRRSFNDDLFTLISAQQPISLILLDIDHFKSFNDNYGHLFGDTVIKGIAKKLQSSCRDGITAYRFGGEEFVLIVPNKTLRIARQFAESLRRSIEKMSVKDRRSGNQVGNITASFGVTELQLGDTSESLIERTDKLLYEAKQLGRNRVMPL
ncbi:MULTISPECIES: GGDEF domain-containing protein [Vibrio]|uniref:diguanylate cyclase n=2 Tax=Vibrio TaxID=662 RepID=A0A191W913_VIBAN|nr:MULTISPECIES: GGDEF domain-containing protein [Vibrio]OXX65853.1 GGDEF domain-containing protein [Vibrio sp. V03_P4A6T147]AQM21040.1 diguanylate cyclase [Vibrio anguillarum]AQP37720.1 diguanylate cyclase [Vibrio anguillarum]ASG02134.1 GGDEF domain-containing protein [Vibrio anguillarum]ASG05859.1 GGDEF domain-containing protein [Vibrio anguillarum]